MLLKRFIPRATSDYWENRANKVLSHFNYKEPDEIDIYDICWRYGVRIKPLDTNYYPREIPDDCKALSIPTAGRKGIIYIQPELDPIDKKIILAEEFCHLYAHNINQVNINNVLLHKSEEQAKRMSAYMLMPQQLLENIYVAARDHAVLLTEIADYFLVTEEFVQYRLELIYKRKVEGFCTIKGKLGSLEWL